MKRSSLTPLACFFCCGAAAWAADATTTVDYTQRNSPYAPATGAAVTPDKESPKAKTNETLQQKRVDKTTIDKATSPLGDRRAAIDLTETREKQVKEKQSHRPEVVEQPKSAFNQRQAGISTAGNTYKPPMVSKYQDSLTSASATNMARFPAIDRATGAKINRFVFRKNPSDAGALANETKAVTPAAGGASLQK
jgi:hypothetical protein